jgi:oligopeptide/dipeptide ABC transporter ATP-binding protein
MPISRARIAGKVLFDGQNLLNLSGEQLRRIRGTRISYVFQNPDAALNPTHTIGSQLESVVAAHRSLSKRARKTETLRLLDLVGIPEASKKADQYPHQFSGGLKQRAVIAMALANNPDLLVADEPTSALDVLAQETILNLLKELRTNLGMSMIVVSHDLRIVRQLADKLVVLYGGRVVETGPARRVLDFPRHRYTDALLRCVPDAKKDYARGERLQAIPGNPIGVSSIERTGCIFADRCAHAQDKCRDLAPPGESEDDDASHIAWCWFPVPRVESREAEVTGQRS